MHEVCTSWMRAIVHIATKQNLVVRVHAPMSDMPTMENYHLPRSAYPGKARWQALVAVHDGLLKCIKAK